jgi:hypothetical protein
VLSSCQITTPVETKYHSSTHHRKPLLKHPACCSLAIRLDHSARIGSLVQSVRVAIAMLTLTSTGAAAGITTATLDETVGRFCIKP